VQLRHENRNVVSSLSVEKASSELAKGSPVHDLIERSFQLLKRVEGTYGLKLVEPVRRAHSSYVLLELLGDAEILRSGLSRHGISVMWGPEFGLTDRYFRLEMSEPKSVRAFLDALKADRQRKQSA
jgi:hypothetical protein